MTEVGIIGLNPVRVIFQASGSEAAGVSVLRPKLRCDQVFACSAIEPRNFGAMESGPGMQIDASILNIPQAACACLSMVAEALQRPQEHATATYAEIAEHTERDRTAGLPTTKPGYKT